MKNKTKKDMENFYLKRTILILIILVLSLTLTYAWLSLTITGTKKGTVMVGTLSIALKDNSSKGIQLNNSSPVVDEVGMTYTPYSFSITNDGNIKNNYFIYMDDAQLPDGYTRMKNSYIKYNLVKNNNGGPGGLLSSTQTNEGKLLDSGSLSPGEKVNYDLRLWIDNNAESDYINTAFAGKIRVEAEQIKE